MIRILLLLLLPTLSFCAQGVGGLFVAPVLSDDPEQVEKVAHLIRQKGVGGVIFMGGTIEGQKRALQRLENESDGPLLTFQDAEWGIAMRLRDASAWPRNLTLGAVGDLELLHAYGLQLARECREVGVRGNFAPVVDLLHYLENRALGFRCLGSDPQGVAKRGAAIARGMEEGGVWSTAKHFPGHGATKVDSHVGLPRIEQMDLAPFEELIRSGVSMVMIGHLLYPPVSALPSSLSPEIVTGILREKLGFEGVVVTDALNMKALTQQFSFDEIALRALLAGSDLLLTAIGDREEADLLVEEAIPRAIDRIEREVQETVIEEHLQRIEAMRQKKQPPMPTPDPSLRERLYRAALTQVGAFAPFKEGEKIGVALQSRDPLFEAMLSEHAPIEICRMDEADLIVFQRADSSLSLPEGPLVIFFDLPRSLPTNPVLIAYENVPETKRAAADALFGKFTPLGKLPIPLSKGNGREKPL